MQTWEADLLAELERLGEEDLRAKQLRTEFGAIDSPRYQFVENWLRSKRDAREEARRAEALSIAREANCIARSARAIAVIAAVAAIVAAIAAIIK